MKNILFENSSHDGGTNCFIDDLDKLDTFTSEQYNPIDISNCKELIEFTINNTEGNKTFKHSTQQGYEHNRRRKVNNYYGNTFGVNRGEMFDECGYLLINILHDCYGFTKPPFTVEHMVGCHSYI
jgi:hypothetical protein